MAKVIYQPVAGRLRIDGRDYSLEDLVMDWILSNDGTTYLISIESGVRDTGVRNTPLSEIEDNVGGTYANIAAWLAWWEALETMGDLTATITDGATEAKQDDIIFDLTDGSQKAQLVDASANFLYPSGEVATGSAEITRPSDTTAYASGDSINSSTSSPVASEITGMAIKSGGGGLLDSIKIESDITAMASKTVRVWVFNDTPATITNDNAAFATAYADKAKLLFFEDVVMEALEGTSDNVIGVLSVAKAYKCAATSLFILVQAVSAFTPTSGGKVNVTLNAIKLN
jgi:hypothetical protein